MSRSYLKEDSYYNDLYDLFTIKRCIRLVNNWDNTLKDGLEYTDLSKLSPEGKKSYVLWAINLHLFYVKGERFRNKEVAVNEWRERDRIRDERLNNAHAPENIHCQHCNNKMKAVSKDLYDLDGAATRVLFFLECPVCNKGKGIFDDGKVFVPRIQRCAKCSGEIKVSYVRAGKMETWVRSCQLCGFTETEIEDREKKDAALAEERGKDRELLNTYRDEYCLAPAEGQEYVDSMSRIEGFITIHQEAEQKRADPDWQRVMNLKKLSVADLEKQISGTLENDKYTRLTLNKPDIGRYVIVPFTVQDADPSRNEKNSVYMLCRIIKTALEGTNWRLMSEGVYYRLGYLSGRLKGYEREEDLLQMVKGGGKNQGPALVCSE